jgi:hypothetical protein
MGFTYEKSINGLPPKPDRELGKRPMLLATGMSIFSAIYFRKKK